MQRLCSRQSSPADGYRIQAVAGLLLAIACLGAGCAAWVTYPPIEGAAHVGAQRLEPVPTIMTEAIRYSNDRFARMQEEIVFNLPAGSPPALYGDVARRLGNARPMTAEDELAIHVVEVRIRALDAEADVIYPRHDGHHEMVTLRMRQTMLYRHEVRHSRLWRIAVEPPPPHYEPQNRRAAPQSSSPDEQTDARGEDDELKSDA